MRYFSRWLVLAESRFWFLLLAWATRLFLLLASASGPGQLQCSYSIDDAGITMFETMDSINAMDIHVGHCFPHFVKMLPHCEMDTLIGTCDETDLEYWTKVCNSWGAANAACYPAL